MLGRPRIYVSPKERRRRQYEADIQREAAVSRRAQRSVALFEAAHPEAAAWLLSQTTNPLAIGMVALIQSGGQLPPDRWDVLNEAMKASNASKGPAA